MRWLFYVYALINDCRIAYIGKGSGYRLTTQKRHFGLDGYEVARFKREKHAFAFERTMIAEYSPPLNRCAGGNGGRYGMERSYKPWTPESLAKSRVNIAEYLLSKDRRG